ncbi:MAG: hypothetical protein AAGI13_14985 [Pseudomonadota bacterium]
MIEDDKPEALDEDALEAAGGGAAGENLYVSGADPASSAAGSKIPPAGENLYISSTSAKVWHAEPRGVEAAFAAKSKKS